MSTLFYLIIYDLPDSKPANRRRTKLHKMLTGYGTWTQYSVFECFLNAALFAKLKVQIETLIKPAEDSVRIYVLDAGSVRKTITYGKFPLWTRHEYLQTGTYVIRGIIPSLKYLALLSSDYSDNIAAEIVNSLLLRCLAVLDLSQGTLTDFGAEILLKCPAINQLHTLNVSINKLSARMVQKLSELNCRVITQPQDNGERQQFLS
ncbi:CRISPR-associated protein Cas2 [Calothrix sp. NIES-4071]|nr:CRISPR-associated protein Cas2 [Calothrix sp. NIES-4071]BAZ60076.1 CRISPR-associated protein Cas2 [Calothrix sp. NIES-4105]